MSEDSIQMRPEKTKCNLPESDMGKKTSSYRQDDGLIRRDVAETLNGNGFEVIKAADTDPALSTLQADRPVKLYSLVSICRALRMHSSKRRRIG
jgi:hypothetical protein